MTNVDIVRSEAFKALFLHHCISDGASLLNNDENAKTANYFRDGSRSSEVFNQYLKKSYAFYCAEVGLLAANDDICFLIDTENTLVILGTNPLMMVNKIAKSATNCGFHEVIDYASFEAHYTRLFGSAQAQLSGPGYDALYRELPVWCPGRDTAFVEDEE